MSSDRSLVDFIVDQMGEAGAIRAKAMFGEFGIYCGGVFVALVCDDQLFIKPTDAGRALVPGFPDGIPYPKAKPHIMVPADAWDDRELLGRLVAVTAAALPAPAPRKPKAPKP